MEKNFCFCAEISRLSADLASAGARLAGWSRQDPTAVGTFVPSWFVFMRIGLMGMGEGCLGIRSVSVPGS